MARKGPDFATPIRRVLIGLLAIALVGLFLFWRIDSPRAEKMRTVVIDRVVPSFEWAMAPVTQISEMIAGFQSYARLYEQNQELRRELRKAAEWKEAAVRLQEENSKLSALNEVRIDPELTSVTGVVMVDSGSAFRQSVLLNVGSRDGIVDGWATMDGLGLVGRISGVGERTSRVILLTDPSSRIPVTIQPSGIRALLTGDNSPYPLLDFIENPDNVRAGDRAVTSGDGGVFPSGLLVGHVAQGADGRTRLRLAADYGRLEFLRVVRSHPAEQLTDAGALIAPETEEPDLIGPLIPEGLLEGGLDTQPLVSGPLR
ncbi:rod shape-determining protein MreC [Paracoccus saliphilus]|uniref:Cell shape-determining protein MreC n=1 Tax=Paracoccus saliphilus TaxID=405559 RepID=A0AA45W1W3_9RHOB|nr:rod shape-determining protein MreC [Paracoccus saliphilus]WCR01734.1 rod shape-determining protein MreC [Paracoccus saliphilus]SIS62649.1 rod shape-determining protein MreC [Paracoccus saliphilus]